jgi:predicted nucleic acid-binding protein
VERKRLVIDANILIRGCLGVRVRTLIADYADQVDFFVAEANVAEAAHYIADLAREKNLDEAVCTEALLSLMRVVQMVEDTGLESAREEALARIRDADDWPALALGFSWSAPFGRRTRTSLAPALRPGPAAQSSVI